MSKKIFFSDMVDGAGTGLQRAFSAAVAKPLSVAWHYATGNNRMAKRNICFNDDDMVGFSIVGGIFGGLLTGIGAGFFLEGVMAVQNVLPYSLGIWGGMTVGAPFVTKQVANAYRASEHDKNIYLLEQKRKEEVAQLPPPSENSGQTQSRNRPDPIRMT